MSSDCDVDEVWHESQALLNNMSQIRLDFESHRSTCMLMCTCLIHDGATEMQICVLLYFVRDRRPFLPFLNLCSVLWWRATQSWGLANSQCQKGTCPGAGGPELLSSAHKRQCRRGRTARGRGGAVRAQGEHMGLLSTVSGTVSLRRPVSQDPWHSHWHWPLNPN